MEKAHRWAQDTFGDADLGDGRRVRRLVELAAGVCRRPGGRVTHVFQDSAAREGAFRLLENAAVNAQEVAQASHRSTARRCSEESMVFVPVDQTSLSFSDRTGTKFGPTGNKNEIHRGMYVMNALAVDSQGTTLGLLAQEYWVRPEARCPKWKQDRRPAHERESCLWRRALCSATKAMNAEAPACTPWYQLDRGADFGDVLCLAHEHSLLLTVRSAHNRALEGRSKGYLRPRMKAQPILGHMFVDVPAQHGRSKRTAKLNLRARRLRFRVAEPGKQRRSVWVEMCAVLVTEPGKRDGIEWMLWTSYPVECFEDAVRVAQGYTMRWRIEEFHRAWKSSHCKIESSQLRSVDAMRRWGAITAAVAARAEHLKLRSRAEPDAPADSEISRDEIDAAILLSETKKHKVGDPMTLQQVVSLIAQVGGYIGKSSGGPPGTITLSRGFERVEVAAHVLARMRSG